VSPTLHRLVAVGQAQDGCHREEQDVFEGMQSRSRDARVGQGIEMLMQARKQARIDRIDRNR